MKKTWFTGQRFSEAKGESPLTEKTTQAMLAALKAVHSASAPADGDLEGLARQRQSQNVLGRLFSPQLGFTWEPFSLGEMPMAWARPECGHDRYHVVLYCHGGGYTSGNLGYARILASKLSQATGYDVLSFEYRLAPEHPYPAALEDALTAWNYLMELGYGARDVVLAGDSAGGNLALELVLSLKKAGRRLPGKLVLYSPWTDLSCSGASYSEHEQDDPILTRTYLESVRQAYAPQGDWEQPELSPLFADLSEFPPTLIQYGGHEILADDSTRLKKSLDQAGVPNVLQCWPNMWHVFPMFPLPQAQQAMERVALFVLTS
ncbi:alpha/beta hydrolase [uncultured Ruthenibacterium sp.]|uniref:alpha/beta hydrolase n=1 Tax=uncultured Ruthenibacterium sp. TaxID=1905347 RepID=UPI00349EA778